MKIGIYNEPAGNCVGGAEYCAVVLAEALCQKHAVEIVHHKPSLEKSQLTRLFRVSLDDVNLRYLPYQPQPVSVARSPWGRLRESRSWHVEVTQPYDLVVVFAHGMPPFCHSRKAAVVVLFPYFDRATMWSWVARSGAKWATLRTGIRRAYYEWEWRRRMAGYQVKAAISSFSADWTKQRWATSCELLYPPVEIEAAVVEKGNNILSVARFTEKKQQSEMLSTFREFVASGEDGWQYISAGALGSDERDRNYFANLNSLVRDGNIRLVANADHSELKQLYGRAKIFWHAKGYQDDEASSPELMEHFGITTVEAMAAGCVPVVINKGGQREIVQHGVNGFLWNNLGELAEHTKRLAKDDGLWKRMSEAARTRAREFDRRKYVERALALLDPLLND